MTQYELFSPIDPYAQGMLRVDDLHTLYWEECGNPKGVPVVFLHGGPGAGASVTHRRFFDPFSWRIVIFDQRGAGRSHPLGEIRRNTTELLCKIGTVTKYLELDTDPEPGKAILDAVDKALAARKASAER